MDLKKLRDNTTVKLVQREVGTMTKSDVWKELERLREQKKMIELVETALTDRVKHDLGENDQMEMVDGMGAYYQYRTTKEVSMSSARSIVEDADTIDLISKIDMKKAKDQLTGEVFKRLEDTADQIKTIKILKFGKLKAE